MTSLSGDRDKTKNDLFCPFKPYILGQFLFLSLSLDNDVMATLKSCV